MSSVTYNSLNVMLFGLIKHEATLSLTLISCSRETANDTQLIQHELDTTLLLVNDFYITCNSEAYTISLWWDICFRRSMLKVTSQTQSNVLLKQFFVAIKLALTVQGQQLVFFLQEKYLMSLDNVVRVNTACLHVC